MCKCDRTVKRFRPHPSYKLKGGVELDFLTWSVKGELQLVLNMIWDVDVKVQLTLGDDWSSCEKRAHELSLLTGKRHKTYIVFWKDCRSASVSSMASLAWNQHRSGYKRKHRNWSQQCFKSVLFCNLELFLGSVRVLVRSLKRWWLRQSLIPKLTF